VDFGLVLRRPIETATLCRHPKQGIRGTRNQSLATGVEVGFLGSLCQGRLHLARATSQKRTSGPCRRGSILAITSELPVIRPGSMPSAEITFYKPTSQD